MKYKTAALSLFVILIAQVTLKAADTSRVQLFPVSKLVPLFSADTRAHRMYLQSNMENRTFYFGMGSQIPVLQFANKFQFSLGASAHATMKRTSIKNAIVNTDYYIDLVGDYKVLPYLYLRGIVGHTSHHLSDDGIALGYTDNNYQRDYVSAYGVFNYENVYTVYGGLVYNTVFRATTTQTPKLMPHAGVDYAIVGSRKYGYLFAAIDVKWKEELNFGTTINTLIGYRYFNQYNQTCRLVLQNTSGYDERGQFYNKKVNIVAIALQLEI
jgi:hypothetical protein